MELIDDVGQAWRFFSIHCMVLAGAIVETWEWMPEDFKQGIDPAWVHHTAFALLFMGVCGRLIKQQNKGDLDDHTH
jgi:hypothetical protein